MDTMANLPTDVVRCCRCWRTPNEISSCCLAARANGYTSAEWFVRCEEGTFNRSTLLFACDECYIAMGQPTGGKRGRWTPQRRYALDEVPGSGPLGTPGTPLREAQDRIGDMLGVPRRA
jgi:hypothetical protein